MASEHPTPIDAGVARLVRQLDDNRREAFEERAGILEFDAGIPREDAERRALIEVLARYGFPGTTPVRLQRAELRGTSRWLLTGSPAAARRILAERVAGDIVEFDLADVLTREFGQVALLVPLS